MKDAEETDVCECGCTRSCHCQDDECCHFELTREEGGGYCFGCDSGCQVFKLARAATGQREPWTVVVDQ